jgi:hypothetical protein
MDKDDKKYSVIYYDRENITDSELADLSEQIMAFNKNKDNNFLLLPTTFKQEWVNKEEILRQLNKAIEEVESWE